ncbi:MAG: hypothetical protein ACRDHI_00420 [Actinomycetota bacterium]
MERIRLRRPSASTVVSIFALVLACTGSAVAGSMITSQQIRDDTIRSEDIKDRTIRGEDLSSSARTAKKAQQPKYRNPQWGIIDRNTIGSAVADLRGGPIAQTVSGLTEPPFGIGSLGIQTSDAATSAAPASEKISFGNEVDFVGDPVSGITSIGFHVFTTGENIGAGAPNPNITLEIDPNLAASASNYSSMVFNPPAPTAINAWSGYIDATASGEWYLTGAAGTASGCSQATTCTFSELQTALGDGGDGAAILTIAVSKGRDSTFAGAVDGLRVNNRVYDFEPFGVRKRKA